MFGWLLKRKKEAVEPTPVDLSVYFQDEPDRYAQFKHACIGDYGLGGNEPTLSGCTCRQFQKTGLPCHHMYKVALDAGIYDNLFAGHDGLIEKLESLSSTAFSKFGERLYSGGLENPWPLSHLGRYSKQIADAGLIEVNGSNFLVSGEVCANLYFVIHYIMGDARFQRYRNRG